MELQCSCTVHGALFQRKKSTKNDPRDLGASHVNPIGHVGGRSKIKEEYQKTFEKQYKIPKYEQKETKIEQLENTGVYLDIDCQKDIKTMLNKWLQTMTLYFMSQGKIWDNNTKA